MDNRSEQSLGNVSGHDLTVEQATTLFAEADVPRSPRTIRRYCRNGHLDCVPADTDVGERYMVSRDSIERRIGELKSLVTTGHDQSRPDTSGHDRPKPDMSGQLDTEENESLKERIGELEKKNFTLEIENKAKEQVIGQMAEERKEFFSMLSEQSRTVGILETKLQALEAPKESSDGDGENDESNPQRLNEGTAVEYEHGGAQERGD